MESDIFKLFGKGSKKIDTSSSNCVIYTRVSGKKQMKGMSLETQYEYVTQCAKERNLTICAHFGGTFESASKRERKEFQKMIDYCFDDKNKISKIIVSSLERFSRKSDNSIWLSSMLREKNIEIIAATQPIDTKTSSGRMHQKMTFIFGEFDNDLRREKCMGGVKARLMKGEWCLRPPIGYDIIRINNKRTIEPNKDAPIIKKIFDWKVNHRLSQLEIIMKLKALGYNWGFTRVADTLKNPFYCGKLAHSALEGELVDGIHEKLVSHKIFLQANELLTTKNNGLKTKTEKPEIALKRFIKCSTCQKGMRGYFDMKNPDMPYYKCNTIGCRNNRNALAINQKFEAILNGLMVDEKYLEIIKEQLKITFEEQNKDVSNNKELYTKQVEALNSKLERLEERFILEEINGEQYLKYKEKFEHEKKETEALIQKNTIEVSRLEDFIDFSLGCTIKLSKMWASGNYTQRQELQNTLFEHGIEYNREKDECRDLGTNFFVKEIARISRHLSTFTNLELQNFKIDKLHSVRACRELDQVFIIKVSKN